MGAKARRAPTIPRHYNPRDPLRKKRQEHEVVVAAAFRRFFIAQYARVIAALEQAREELEAARVVRAGEFSIAKQGIELPIDWNAEKMELDAVVGDVLKMILSEASDAVKEYVERLGVRVNWEIWDREAEVWAKQYGYDLIQQITDSTRKQIGEAIARWIAGDRGFPDLVEKIGQICPVNPFPHIRDRAQVIAATEVTRVYADARVAGFKAIGLTRMRWRTARDELVCPICAPLGLANDGHGMIGSVTDGFVHPEMGNKIARPPAHVSCRCWIVEDHEELNTLLIQQEQAELSPVEQKPEAPSVLPGPRAAIAWKPVMFQGIGEIERWQKGALKFPEQFYIVVNSHDQLMEAENYGFSLKPNISFGKDGKAIMAISQHILPNYGMIPGQQLCPVAVRVKYPKLVEIKPGESISKQIAAGIQADGWDPQVQSAGEFLATHGYDSAIGVSSTGKILYLYVFDKRKLAIVGDLPIFDSEEAAVQYHKAEAMVIPIPASTFEQELEPAHAQAPTATQVAPFPAPSPPAALPILDWSDYDLDHALLKTLDLHGADLPWGLLDTSKKASYGAVIVDEQGRVLLRKPTGEYGGYVWTWPKGGADPQEHPIDTLTREVEEETGHKIQIIGFVPGGFEGDTTNTWFAIARSVAYDPAMMGWETERIEWATAQEAETMIEQTRTAKGKKRDLEVLNRALDEYRKLQDPNYRAAVKQRLGILSAPVQIQPAVPIPDRFPWTITDLKVIPRYVGGMHEKTIYIAPDGSEWLFKPQEEWRAQIDRTTYELARALGLPAAETYIVTLGGRVGSIQRMFTGVIGDLGTITDLTEEQVALAQREAIFDWLIGNHDGHKHNVLVLNDGTLVGIDKGQAFKFYDRDRLDYQYNPNPEPSWYNERLRRWAEGEDVLVVAPDHPILRNFLLRVEAFDEDELRRILHPYAEKALTARGMPGKRTALPYDDIDAFMEAFMKRKRSLTKIFIKQYEEVVEQRLRVFGIPPDVLTPITDKFVKEIVDSGWAGKALLFGGEDIEDMYSLIYKFDDDGTALELKIRKPAESKILNVLGLKNDKIQGIIPEPNISPRIPVASPGKTLTETWVSNRDGRLMRASGTERTRSGNMIEIALSGGITIQYIPHDDKANYKVYSSYGKMRIIIPDSIVTEQTIYKALEALKELGINTHLAKRKDIEYLYLVKTAYAAGILNRAGLKDSMTLDEKINALVNTWNTYLGKDIRSLPNYNPMPHFDSIPPVLRKAGIKTGTFGPPRWRRFDYTENDIINEFGEDVMLVHGLNGLYGGGPTYDKLKIILDANGSLISTEEKFRLGIPLSNTSPEEDQKSGGGFYVFTRIFGKKAARLSKYNLFFDKRLLLDTDAISYDSDKYGDTHDYIIDTYRKRNPRDWYYASWDYHNETTIKRSISLIDYLVGIRVEDIDEKKKVIALLKSYGITKLGGNPLSKAVWVRKTPL